MAGGPEAPPRDRVLPKDRILDVYGSFGRGLGGWLPVGALIALLAPVRVDEQAVRSAASRMKRSGLLVAERVGGAAGYRLSPAASEILEDGDARIFRDPRDAADASWVVAVFSVPEAERDQRYAIRSRLARLGFGQGPAGSWFAPAVVMPETRRMLRRHGLSGYVTLWRAGYAGFTDFRRLVASAWDLDGTRRRYEDFLGLAAEVEGRWDGDDLGDEAAFIDYMEAMARWRPLPYLDPGLPASVTPRDWPGPSARDAFSRLEPRLRPAATRFFVSVAAPLSR